MTRIGAGTVAKLLDFLRAERDLPSDAALGREMNRDPAYISNLRAEKIPLSANVVLFIHVNFGIGVQEIFERAGQKPDWLK
jgi:hypothetical protein